MKNIMNQGTRFAKALTKSINLLAVTLILSDVLVKTQALTMDEAPCSPRPVTVAVTDKRGNEFLPYHVVLHRCSGTCHNTSPRIKACKVKDYDKIDLKVTDVNNEKTTVEVTNHTSCQCSCRCKPNESVVDPHSCKCRCLDHENCGIQDPVSSGARKNDEQKQPIPYMIAIAAVGIFAIIVFLFDAKLYFKKKGFFYSLKKHVCCKPENNKHSTPEQQESSQRSCNGTCKQTSV